jgi:eukaryotic-like serine/threonine-protein kinase
MAACRFSRLAAQSRNGVVGVRHGDAILAGACAGAANQQRNMSISAEQEMMIFNSALEIADLTQRQIFLDRACAGDQELRASIDDLLTAQANAEQFFPEASSFIPLTGHVADVAAPGEDGDSIFEERPGAIFGRYKVIEKIGEGGCGTVYLAEQEQPVRRRVALKVIKLGMDTRSVIARFEAERQALAMMDHPNIARVFDAGATDQGRPYFVMELVNGVKITSHCDEHWLGMEGRLELFIQMCQAIQHAHQKGIIHRDIKPSNVLVSIHDGVSAPKVIDFGIAKAMEERLTDKTLITAYAQLIGTPAYMSPEQIELGGPEPDARSDIYSLGVLLYELLTGRTPFDARELIQSSVDEMRRTLLEREPCTPSARLRTLSGEELAKTARHRGVAPPQLASKLRGDLDWIVMKALEKDRSRRYETANDLAMDVRRYLANEPVQARPPNRWYLLQKRVRRNHFGFVAGAAVAAALLIGAVTSTWLYLQERDAQRRATAAQRKAIAAQQEADSRRDAESLGKVAQAEWLLSREDFAGADQQLDGITLENRSAETVAMLRKLGDWDAENGRWQQAAARFKQLVHVNREADLNAVMIDHLELGPALVNSGELDDYERFRQEMLARYGATGSVDGDLMIKFTLLLPANEKFVENLLPRAESTERDVARFHAAAERNTDEAWGSLALALFEYRHGHYAKAAEWSRGCLAYPEYVAPRSAAVETILAMSCWQMKQKEDALLAVKQAREMIAGTFQPGTGVAIGPKYYWFDWEFAGILMRECEELFTEADPSLRKIFAVEPGGERAASLRTQGEGHAARQEWRAAADSFEALLKVNQREGRDVATQDFLDCGTVVAELGDDVRFRKVCEEAVARFSGTEQREACERVIKLCLLRPPSGKLFADLAPLAARIIRPLGKDEEKLSQNPAYNASHAIAMTLLEGRRPNYPLSVEWCHRAVAPGDALPYSTAIGRAIMVMELYQLKQVDAARQELQQARDLIETRLKKDLDQDNWRDWLFAHVLLREATNLVSSADPPKAPQTR